MIKTESRQLGDRGYTYSVQQFGAREGMRILVRLAKMLGKPIGEAVGAGEGLDLSAAGAVISGLAESVSEDEFIRLCDSFGKRSAVSGGDAEQPPQFQYGGKTIPLSDGNILDLHFAGSYVELVAWLAFALEVNYGSFLAVVAAAKTDLAASLQGSVQVAGSVSKSTFPSTSETTGKSGASPVHSSSPTP